MIDLNNAFKKEKGSSGIYIIRGRIVSELFTCLSGNDYTIVIGNPYIIQTYVSENNLTILFKSIDSMNTMIPLKDIAMSKARIEYGAIIREHVTLNQGVVVLMGAIINLNVSIDENTMIDMNAVIGSGAIIGKRVHIGAGAVIAGMLEPISNVGVIIEDDVLVGANAVILEGVHIKSGAIIGAGAIVREDVGENMVMVGIPAKFIKMRDECEKGININFELH
ncbi:MAG: DapH/DapD/GlmU-related protein [Erysipelotrichaceae bacterium]